MILQHWDCVGGRTIPAFLEGEEVWKGHGGDQDALSMEGIRKARERTLLHFRGGELSQKSCGRRKWGEKVERRAVFRNTAIALLQCAQKMIAVRRCKGRGRGRKQPKEGGRKEKGKIPDQNSHSVPKINWAKAEFARAAEQEKEKKDQLKTKKKRSHKATEQARKEDQQSSKARKAAIHLKTRHRRVWMTTKKGK